MCNMSRVLMMAVMLALLSTAIGIFWVAEVDNYRVAPRAERRGGSCPVPSDDRSRQDRLARIELSPIAATVPMAGVAGETVTM